MYIYIEHETYEKAMEDLHKASVHELNNGII
jgi:hypothetical protein